MSEPGPTPAPEPTPAAPTPAAPTPAASTSAAPTAVAPTPAAPTPAVPAPASQPAHPYGARPVATGPGPLATWTPGGPGTRPEPALPPPLPPSRFMLARDAFWASGRTPASAAVLVTCGIVGVAGGALVVGHRLGLGLAVVGLAVWAVAVPALVRRRAFGDLATVALSIALVAMVAVRDAGWVVALCILTAALAGAAAATSARSAPAVLLSALTWTAGAFRSIPWVKHGAGALVGERRGEVLVALRSIGVTVVLLVVFGALFASADSVFASYIPRPDVGLLPGQLVVGVLVALLAASLGHLALVPPSWSSATLPPGRPARLGEWVLPVGALAALVLAFVLVQVSALLGGHDHVLETAGLGYAEYARQGFAQLVVVTALTLVVVAVAARRAPRETPRERLVTRIALGLLCLGTLGVVASAVRRMDLYVEAFGLTRLRLVVVAVELVLGVVLVLVLVAGVRWRGAWLPRAAVQVTAVAMLALALVNPDALIVRANTTDDLAVETDVLYLRDLSADAVPAMDSLGDPVLRGCLLDGTVSPGPDAPAGWNLGRSRAVAILDSFEETGSADGEACSDYYEREGRPAPVTDTWPAPGRP